MSMSIVAHYSHLRHRWRAMIMPIRVAALLAFAGVAPYALAQEAAETQREELDVTMEIIADPDAKLPDEVVRRIPLPVRKPDGPSDGAKEPKEPKEKQREPDTASAAPGREISENAKDRAKQAAEQREEAQRSVVNERRRNPDPPSPPPRPNPRPPRN